MNRCELVIHYGNAIDECESVAELLDDMLSVSAEVYGKAGVKESLAKQMGWSMKELNGILKMGRESAKYQKIIESWM